ncbi:MAG: glycosyltransferase family 1 protein [bacterium]
MRLALYTDTFAPQMNGVTRTLGRLVAAVRERGGDASVFTTSDPRAGVDDRVGRWPSIRCPKYPELRVALPNPTRAMNELLAFRPTLVHAATPFALGASARSAARSLGIPLVTSYHTSFSDYARFYGVGYLERPIWSALRAFHNAGRRTFCPTEVVRRELAAHGFERLSVWGRGVDRAHFTPSRRTRDMRHRMGAGDGSIVVAYVGRIAPEKGIDHLLEAMTRLAAHDSTIVLVLAGDGPYLDHCRAIAPPNCRFLGRMEGLELAAFYASADTFVFPSSTDTFGNVLLEAMASGLPILAADTPASREVLGGAGAYYEGDSATALAASLTELAYNHARRAHAGATSLARSADFDWSRVFDALFDEYDRAADATSAVSLVHRRLGGTRGSPIARSR